MNRNSVKVYVGESSMNLYSWALICDGFALSKVIKRYIGETLRSQVMVIKNDSAKWGVEESNWDSLGNKINQKLRSGTFDMRSLLKEHLILGSRLLESASNIISKDIKILKNQEYLLWFEQAWADSLKLNTLGFMPVASDFDHTILSKNLIDILQKHIDDASQVQIYLSTLISTDRPDLSWQEQLDFFKLIIKLRTLGRLKNSRDLENHIKKYCWVNFGYIGPAWNKKDFLDRAKKILSSNHSLNHQYNEHRSHFINLKSRQRIWEKKIELSKIERDLFAAARMFMFLKAYRLNVRHKIQYVSELIFAELAKRHKLSINSFRYAHRREITAYLLGDKVDLEKAAKRRKGYVEIRENGKVRHYTLNKAKRMLEQIIIKEKPHSYHKVFGQAAYLGKVKGRAKIVFGIQDMAKVNRGDILFAITTTPDLLPAMHKAKAFVTDQGGITSHASIMAREMKKPCVIGTKFGTKIFKDGDMVEVDANNGIVRKI